MATKKTPKLEIAYFGEPGSFSHLAAKRRYPQARLESCPTVEECFYRLLGDKVNQIVVPIENASSGMITSTVDQLVILAAANNPYLFIRESIAMRIRLALLARKKKMEVKKIYSHLAPFNHARAWLQKHYPKAQQIIVESTSEAAKRAQKEHHAAAIAGLQSADLYKLKVMRSDVGSEIANQTTFFVIGHQLPKPTKPTLTSLILELAHKPGSLVGVLNALADEKLNLTKIESRPIAGRFNQYRFMIEFEGVPGSRNFERALQQVRKRTQSCRLAGSYPLIKLG